MIDLIDKIYNNTAVCLTERSADEYVEELTNNYKKYLIKTYGKFLQNGVDLNRYIDTFIDLENIKWKNVPIDTIYSEFLNDEAYNKIVYISNEGFNYAALRINNDRINNNENIIDYNYANERINILKNELSSIKSFNKKIAEKIVSEGIIDFEYASRMTDKMSFRVSKMKLK